MSLQSSPGVSLIESSSEPSSPTRAAIYARTSSASQRFGYSIGEQVRQCIDRCQMMEWDPVFIFRDEAESGKDTDRPMFQEMLEKATRGAFDVLVFWKLDRFSRSIMHAVQLENEFRELGVALHSVTEQLDTTSAAGRFNFRNIANAAEFERDMIKQRTKMGHTALAMGHKWPNSTPPLGYERQDEGFLRIIPKEAALVRRIFKQYPEDKSMPVVAAELNDVGYATKQGREWSSRDIGSVLGNRIYSGRYSVGEITESVEEYRIISDELFDRSAAVRRRFRSAKKASRPSMNGHRKKNRVASIHNQYIDYILGIKDIS